MLHDQEEVLAKNAYTCCTPDDIEDARVVASQMGIPFHVVNFMDGFREKIVDKFIDTYLRGETPNPCIDCNRYMKFGRLFEMADEKKLNENKQPILNLNPIPFVSKHKFIVIEKKIIILFLIPNILIMNKDF